MQVNAVTISNVCFQYDTHPTLCGVSFEIKEGTSTAIVGENGGGKTTLLKLLLGILAPQSGTISIFGEYVSTRKTSIGYVPQKISGDAARFPATVREVVLTHPKTIHRSIEEILEDARLTGYQDRLLAELSGGQRQRVFLARAIANIPKLLILDEPTTGVDRESVAKFYQTLDMLRARYGTTIIIVSHDLGGLLNHVQRVIAVNQTVTFDGTPEAFEKEFHVHGVHV